MTSIHVLPSGRLVACVLLASLFGCEQRPTAPVTEPATAPATVPAVAPATQPVGSIINIGNQIFDFPPARMRIERSGQTLVALLFSDDPKDALKDDYPGNSFYLRMELDVTDPEQLKDAQWHYAVPSSSEREDSPYGIYLGGKKIQLQPFNVDGKFSVSGEETRVTVGGQFQVLDDAVGSKGPTQLMPVLADLVVRVDTSAVSKD